MTATTEAGAINKLADLLNSETGQTLSEARRWRIDTLLRPILRDWGCKSLDDLLCAIEREPNGPVKAATIDAMLNHESSFFRDISVFQTLENVIIPRLVEQASEQALRIWSVGCSTGQEAYSLAMMVKRSPLLEGWRLSIQATDVSALAIEKAKQGRFSQMDVQRGLPINELLRWFVPVGSEWRVVDELREMITFRADNVLRPDRVTGPFDLILCRNVLFYFPKHHRLEACEQIASKARSGAVLVLGAGEMLPGDTSFAACRATSGIYIKQERGRGSSKESRFLVSSASAGLGIGLDGV